MRLELCSNEYFFHIVHFIVVVVDKYYYVIEIKYDVTFDLV